MARRVKSTNPRKPRKNGAGKIRRVAHEPSVSHLRRPMGMDVKAWQTQLRRQFGRAQSFTLKNLGDQAVFSDFQVTNPQNGNRIGWQFVARVQVKISVRALILRRTI
jgi:hypothetical protein